MSGLEGHLAESLSIWGEILVAVTTKEPATSQGLRVLFFDAKAAILILHVVSCRNNIVGNFKEVPVVSTVRTLKTVNNLGSGEQHR